MNQALVERDHIESIVGKGPGDPDIFGYPGQHPNCLSTWVKPAAPRFWDILPKSYCTVNRGDHFPRIIYKDFFGHVAVCACGAKTRNRINFE